MSFTLPDFNLEIDVWVGTSPPVGPPDDTFLGAWVMPRRTTVFSPDIPGTAGYARSVSYLLLPIGSSVHTMAQHSGPGLITYSYMQPRGMPATFFLLPIEQVLVGAGHPNEHVQVRCASFGAYGPVLPSLAP